ncbi:MAG TPA: hypothetical protein VGR02_12325, partial [Thermoanaerobaculia bacterium]|nr:hypothetical protein [Thermoanaerobaculia bacterium]
TLKDTPGQERRSAYEISVVPGTDTVFVGTSDGSLVSFNGGASWNPFPVFSGADKTVFSVMATAGRILFGGPSGVRTASANLILQPLVSANPIRSMHAFAQRGTTQHVFFVDDSRLLFVSLNGGDVWTRIEHEPEGTGRCAGAPFIKAVDHGASAPVDLYYSNRCTLHKLVAPMMQGLPNYFVDDWHEVEIDHGGPRDLALVGSTPLLLASTAGVHDQAANEWHLVGGGREGGLNALQINEIKGQFVPGQLHPDLYVGTNENGMWAANAGGDIVSPGGNENPPAPDGHFIELKLSPAAGLDSRITFLTSTENQQSERNLVNAGPWPDPSGGQRKAPVLLQPCRYVQNVTRTKRMRGMDVTVTCGASWDPFADFTVQTTDIPKLGLVAGGSTFLYQSFKRSLDGTAGLMRLARFTGLPTDVRFPAMSSSDGQPAVGLGINATGFGGYQVYAIDPATLNHIIAPDVVNGRMAETTDGGGTWDAMADLTDKVTAHGDRLFTTDLAGPVAGKVSPIVTAVSFGPLLGLNLVGTSEGGIFAKASDGTWQKINDSEKATYITSFFWETANTVYVSTYGRGLWKLRVRAVAPPADFNVLCSTCNLVSIDPGSARPPFDGSALVFNGQMLGVRTDHQKLREVFVTPGSSVVLTGDPDDPQDDIAITESDGRDTSQYEPLPQPKGGIVAGVLFTSDDKLVGAALAESEMTLPQPESKDPVDVKGSTESPTKGRPYITLTTSAAAAVPTAEPMEVFDLSATDFTAGASYEVLVDGTPLKGNVTADSSGSFDTRITAPPDAGYHGVTVRPAGDNTVIERSLFFVRTGN